MTKFGGIQEVVVSLVRMERDRGRLGDTEKEPDRGVVSRRQGLEEGGHEEATSSVFYAFLSKVVLGGQFLSH